MLKRAWSASRAIHLLGFIHNERFREHYALNLLVGGLPSSDLRDAIALGEAARTLPVDLKRREYFNDDLSESVLRRSRRL